MSTPSASRTSTDETNTNVPSLSSSKTSCFRLPSISDGSGSSSTSNISIPSNPNDIFLFKGFLPLDKTAFPSHYTFHCNTLEGSGFLPEQMFQLFSQILAYEYIRKAQEIPKSIMGGLQYFQEMYTLRKKRIIPNDILPRDRPVRTRMGAPFHTMGFTQHLSNRKHPGIISAQPIRESPALPSSSADSSNGSNTSQTPTLSAPSNTTFEPSETVETSNILEKNNPIHSENSLTTTHVNPTTPPKNNEPPLGSKLVTIDPSQHLSQRHVKPQRNSLETNLTLIGLEACSFLCDSFPDGNAKFKELLVTPILNHHPTISNPCSSSNSSNSGDTNTSTKIETQPSEKSKENSPKSKKVVEVIAIDTPTKTIPTKKVNDKSTKLKSISTPVRQKQYELSSSDEESPEVVEEEKKKRKRTATKRKRKEKKSKKNHLGNNIYTVEKVLRKKVVESSEPQYFVKWLGYGDEDNSWVRESDILDLNLIQGYRGPVEYEKKSSK